MAPLLVEQIKSLLYRNYLMKKRLKSQTIQEVAMPIYFAVLLVILKLTAFKPTFYAEETNNQSFSLNNFKANENTTFYVAPDFPDARRLMDAVQKEHPGYSYGFYQSLTRMNDAYAESDKVNIVGLYFKNAGFVGDYMLRFPYDSLPSTTLFDSGTGTCRQSSSGCAAELYLTSGFCYIQNAVDTAIIKEIYGNANYTTPTISVQRFPRESGVSNAQVFQALGSVYLVIAFAPFMSFLIIYVVNEKEKKIKEGMKMMGLESLALWLAWGITYTVLLLVITIVITILAVPGQLYPKSNFGLMFLLFFMYGLSLISLGFMLTPFFLKAKSAGGFASLLTLILGALSLLSTFVSLPHGAIWAICLLSPTAFGTAISQISILELTTGANFNNIWQEPTPLGIPFIMLPIDILLYFVLAMYFDQVIPGEYGQKQSPFFFLLPSFWCPSKEQSASTSVAYVSEEIDMENMEPVSEELHGKEAIRIHNVTKVYGSDGLFTKQSTPTTAVKNFSLNIYEGQITALLGHNGAGKTTLFNILSGFVDATSGRASVYGYDVSNPATMSKIRQMTGVCPQLDILLDVLSVEEHLEVFAGIKGLDKENTRNEIERVIKLIGLETQRDTFAKKLSGGQKRKLSVGIAILGDPKILILDEPTAGMDPFSRNNLWDVLRSRKEGRVTLLTTHFMDEADILADRKAIISRGHLRCVGSSLFLKNKFGIGYHLSVVTKDSNASRPITACVDTHVTGAELQRAIGFELDYTLPLSESHKFADLFHDIEERADELGVQSFGVSMTTLEEVFLKIGEEDEADDDDQDSGNDGPLLNENIRERLRSVSSGHENKAYGRTNVGETNIGENGTTRVDLANGGSAFDPSQSDVGPRSAFAVYCAMAKRLFLIYVRSPGAWIFGLVFPFGLAIGCAPLFNVQTITENYTDPPPVLLNPDQYSNTFLFKNSTGAPLSDLIANTNVTLIQNNLTGLLAFVNQYYMAGDIFQYSSNNMSYNAVYNTKAVHALPSIINLFSSSALSQTEQNLTEIVCQQKRWPRANAPVSFSGGVFGGTMMACIALIMVTSFPAINPVQERELKVSSLMRVSGVKYAVYWGSSFTIDYAWYLTVAVALIISLKAFNVAAFASGGAIGALVLLVLGYGASGVMTSYCMSHLFDKYEVVQSVMPNLVQWVALIPYIPVSMLDQLGSSSAAVVVNVICALLIPYYTGFSGLYYIVKVYTTFASSGRTGVPQSHVYFDWSNPMVPFSILITYVHFVLLQLLLRFVSIKKSGGSLQDFWKVKHRPRAVGDTPPASLLTVNGDQPAMDGDVLEEKEKASRIVSNQESFEEETVVLLHNARKEFVKRQKKRKRKAEKAKVKVAVDQLSLTVNRGQVLGLLGPNGAGKTTAMNLMTADFAPTRGRVFISGQEVLSNVSDAFLDMGYCSQNNPLWEDVTLAEHLEIYATTQGVKKESIQATIDNFVKALGIEEHVNKRAKSLSGGTKRKLCFAIAMLGNPQVVLLDEPSTGMDPKTKRFMWNTISRAFQGTNRGAILTTHYMEEADALCSRVAIMVLGKLRCIGSTQHLKSKFGQGYVLEIKLKHGSDVDEESLRQFVKKLFPEVPDPDQFSNRFVYKISQSSVVSLSSVFREMEEAKQELGIEEYSFSQSTLEQVFLQFAREQEESTAE